MVFLFGDEAYFIEVFKDTLNLFNALHRFRITASLDSLLRQYANYYITEMEGYSDLKEVAKEFDKNLSFLKILFDNFYKACISHLLVQILEYMALK